MSGHETRLAAARLHAIKKRPYYASALLALDTIDHHTQQTLTVDHKGRIHHHGATTANTSVEQLAVRLVHGLEHLLRDHAGRSATPIAHHGAPAWQTATDLEINDDLTDFTLTDDSPTPSHFGLPEGLLAEQYVRLLDATSTGPGRSVTASRRVGPQSCLCTGGLPTVDRTPSPNEPGLAPARILQLRSEVAEEVGRFRGRVPGGVERWATAHRSPTTVDWRRVLRQRVRDLTRITAGATDHDRRRVSRRSPHPFLLPRLVDPVPHPAVVIDTSGSMSADQLGTAIDQVEQILRACGAPEVPVISCDTEVQQVVRITPGHRLGNQPGGGGSDMTPGIERAISERADLIVVITDGWVLWPDRAPRVPVVALIVDDLQDAPPTPDWLVTVRAEVETCSP